MDIAALKIRALQSKTVTINVGKKKKVSFVLPTFLEAAQVATQVNTSLDPKHSNGHLSVTAASIVLLVHCAVDWVGFTENLFDYYAEGKESVPFDKELLETYFKDNLAEVKTTSDLLWFEMDKRAKARAESLKN